MDFIQRLIHYFAVVRTQMRRHRRLVVTCAAVVVFATTYALILPAITLDAETADEQPGLELAAADDAGSEEANSIVTLPVAENDDYRVTVSYDKADVTNIPDGATVHTTIYGEGDSEYVAAKDAVVAAKKAQNADFDESSIGLEAFDISIMDGDNSVEPNGKVTVSIEFNSLPANIADGTALDVQHIVTAQSTAAAKGLRRAPARSQASVEQVASTQAEGGVASATFDVSSFSTFTITWRAWLTTYAQLAVHYVDAAGNELQGPTTQDVSIGNGITKTDTAVDFSSYAGEISDYVYDSAHLDSVEGAAVSRVAFKSDNFAWVLRSGEVDFFDGDEQVDSQSYDGSPIARDVYLVYRTEGLTAEYGDFTFRLVAADGVLPQDAQLRLAQREPSDEEWERGLNVYYDNSEHLFIQMLQQFDFVDVQVVDAAGNVVEPTGDVYLRVESSYLPADGEDYMVATLADDSSVVLASGDEGNDSTGLKATSGDLATCVVFKGYVTDDIDQVAIG